MRTLRDQAVGGVRAAVAQLDFPRAVRADAETIDISARIGDGLARIEVLHRREGGRQRGGRQAERNQHGSA
ncbi:hypothetical protein, partial [Stenotrophomonas sp. SrG]|uniref:hypothetical protein n=1 Tax=Stenotrophomonas sp. SrG TaxID=3414430 RepID=UPI003CEAF340